jgi:zinc and cadmium transporter
MLIVALVTLLGMAGATIGVRAAREAERVRKLVPFSAGLLLGMAFFVIFPEALASGRWPVIFGWSAFGCGLFALVEWYLDKAPHEDEPADKLHHRHIALFPLLVAVCLHNALDGWNVGLATQLPDKSLEWTFLAGMGVHKLTSGAAMGAIFRTAAPSTRVAMYAAVGAEFLTIAGAVAEMSLHSILGDGWTALLLAATGGSFLYLGIHALREARRHNHPTATAGYAGVGLMAIGVLALVTR